MYKAFAPLAGPRSRSRNSASFAGRSSLRCRSAMNSVSMFVEFPDGGRSTMKMQIRSLSLQ